MLAHHVFTLQRSLCWGVLTATFINPVGETGDYPGSKMKRLKIMLQHLKVPQDFHHPELSHDSAKVMYHGRAFSFPIF